MKNFTYRGNWYLPLEANNSITGVLSFSPESGGELVLDDNFDHEFIGSFLETEIILGTTSDLKKITLINCKQFQRSHKATFKIQFILEGNHYEKLEELSFNKVEIRFDLLDQWLNKSGFQVSFDHELRSIDLKYDQPSSIQFSINDEKNGVFDFGFKAPLGSPTSQFIITQESGLTLDYYSGALSFMEVMEDVLHFQHFLSLACFSGSYPLSICLFSEDFKYKVKSSEFMSPFSLYYRSKNLASKREIKAADFLFSYSQIETQFEEIISKWYSIKEIIGPVTDLLLDSFYNSSFFNENRFLNMAQALETFHRRLRRNRIKSKEDHDKMIKAIISGVSKEYKSWLSSKLNFSNEPALHQRLEELIDEVSNSTIEKMIPDKLQFIKEVKWSRNYYTHYDKDLKNKALKGADLYYLTEKMRLVLICSILSELGFTKEKYQDLISKSEYRLFNHIIAE